MNMITKARMDLLNSVATLPQHSHSLTNATAQAQVMPQPTPRIKQVRIINVKNGYLIVPDDGRIAQGGMPLFDESYVAKDLDELKDALARHYVENKLT